MRAQVLVAELSPYWPAISRKSLETDEFSPQTEKGFNNIRFAASALIIEARRKIGRDAQIAAMDHQRSAYLRTARIAGCGQNGALIATYPAGTQNP